MPGLAEHTLVVTLAPKILLENRKNKRAKVMTFYQDMVAITPMGHSQHWRWHSRYEAVNIFISPGLLKTVSQDIVKGEPDSIYLVETNGVSIPFISAIARELLSELETGSPHGKTYIDTLTRSLNAYLIVHHSTTKLADSATLSKPDDARIARAIDFIESHLSEELPLTAIASACNMSVNRLCSVFKNTVGQPVHQFIIRQRIERAKILLRNSKKSLAEIAQETGFASQAHFTTCFRKLCGGTPKRYRQDYFRSSCLD